MRIHPASASTLIPCFLRDAGAVLAFYAVYSTNALANCNVRPWFSAFPLQVCGAMARSRHQVHRHRDKNIRYCTPKHQANFLSAMAPRLTPRPKKRNKDFRLHFHSAVVPRFNDHERSCTQSLESETTRREVTRHDADTDRSCGLARCPPATVVEMGWQLIRVCRRFVLADHRSAIDGLCKRS